MRFMKQGFVLIEQRFVNVHNVSGIREGNWATGCCHVDLAGGHSYFFAMTPKEVLAKLTGAAPVAVDRPSCTEPLTKTIIAERFPSAVPTQYKHV